MTQFDKSYLSICDLVERFKKGIDHYLSPSYQEFEARQDFIDDFFIALGWDVLHKLQQNPYEQEVKVEKHQKQQDSISQKRADYAFYTAPNFKDICFFAEAKKPAANLKNADYYFQTIRYAWNAATPIGVLTDFEEFHILDCRHKPDIRYVFNGHHKKYHFLDYIDKEKFAEIYWLFSREAVGNNSLDAYTQKLPKPLGKIVQKNLFKGAYQAIDESFLEYIDEIREHLAKAFKKSDESLGSDELTEAVTRTIDRLVFIRFLEDKLIETNDHVSEWRSWKDFISDCRKLDAKYNGVVFKDHLLLDKVGFIGADEKMFLNICSDISNLNSPYDFNYIPIHILGSIYERFLGKVVIATEHRVRIEEKLEVRKAGGVYYTPKYIVDIIVANSVEPCIKEKTPKEIRSLRFADIACGSGSFLIVLFDYLLDYHKKYFQTKYANRKEPLDARNEDFGYVELKNGQWILTLKLKQEVLLNNIFGVDIDRQAVEVTQLSLFLKMLEDETVSSTQIRQGSIFSKVLPDLGKNIVCGNSLVETDINLGKLFSLEDEKKLNALDFEITFPFLRNGNGFDAIVGNPPYILSREKMDVEIKRYYAARYSTLWEKPNTFNLFLERGFNLINSKGYLSYIIPNSWLTIESCKLSRKLFVERHALRILEDLNYSVFKNVGVEPLIILISKNIDSEEVKYRRIKSLADYELPYLSYNQAIWNNTESNFSIYLNSNPSTDILLNKIISKSQPIGDLFDVRTGLQAYEYQKGSPKQSQTDVLNRIYDYDYKYDENTYKYLDGKDISRYETNWDGKYLRYGKWLSQPRTIELFTRRRLLLREITSKPPYSLNVTFINDVFLNNKSILNILDYKDSEANLKLLLGQLNSKLLTYYYKNRAVKSSRKLFPKVVVKDLCRYPVILNKEEETEKQIVLFVAQIVECKKQILNAKTEADKNFLNNKIENIERQIDNLVYKLYDLTAGEIEIIENFT